LSINETAAGDAGAQDDSANVDNANENENNNDDSVDCDEEDSEIQPAVVLPPHRKCAAHRLNLVATTDIAKLEGQLKRISVQTFAKLSGLWNKQNRSVTAANAIKISLGTLLVTPGDTRWNSYYNAVE